MPRPWNPHTTGNLARGRAAEKKVRRAYQEDGWTTQTYGWGADFLASKPGHPDRYVEVKSASGKLTKRQRAMQKKHRENYHVEYVADNEVPRSDAMRIREDGHSELDPWAWSERD